MMLKVPLLINLFGLSAANACQRVLNGVAVNIVERHSCGSCDGQGFVLLDLWYKWN